MIVKVKTEKHGVVEVPVDVPDTSLRGLCTLFGEKAVAHAALAHLSRMVSDHVRGNLRHSKTLIDVILSAGALRLEEPISKAVARMSNTFDDLLTASEADLAAAIGMLDEDAFDRLVGAVSVLDSADRVRA
jgi:hypothetical protein